MPSSPNDAFLAVSRHPVYYIQGADLCLLVEHIQFRVHRYFFERESLYFRNYLTVPASPGAVRTGVNDSNAVIIDDVKAAEFELFLWVFYNPKYSLYNRPVEEWEIILKLAHRWTFPEVKNLAVRELEKLMYPDLDRIATYQANAVDRKLLIPYYARLCEREEPLTLPEGMKLGMETTLIIARARELARGSVSPTGARSPTTAHVHGNELHTIVCDLFEIEPLSETPTGDEQTTFLPGGLEPKKPETPVLPQSVNPVPAQSTAPQSHPTAPVTPATKKASKPTGKAKKKGQKKTETPPTPTTNTVPPFPQEGGDKVATEVAEAGEAEVGTEEASLVDVGGQGGENGVTDGEVKNGEVKSDETKGGSLDVLESGATSEGDMWGEGESNVVGDTVVADAMNAENGETKATDDGQPKVEGSGDDVTKIDVDPNGASLGLDDKTPDIIVPTDPSIPTTSATNNDTSPSSGGDLNVLPTGTPNAGDKSPSQFLTSPSTFGMMPGFEFLKKAAGDVVNSFKPTSPWDDDSDIST